MSVCMSVCVGYFKSECSVCGISIRHLNKQEKALYSPPASLVPRHLCQSHFGLLMRHQPSVPPPHLLLQLFLLTGEPKTKVQRQKRENINTPHLKLTHILQRRLFLTSIFLATKQTHFVPLSKHVAIVCSVSERLLQMSMSEHAVALLVAATGWIALSLCKTSFYGKTDSV